MQNLVVILGTNASGKSELGIRLANHLGGEVVSADSRQVYRGLDLGSGKITPAQAGTVKHHLIDVADLADYFSLAQYQQAAYGAIDSISGAGKRPLLVGGTGLFISAIVEGYELVDGRHRESPIAPGRTARPTWGTVSGLDSEFCIRAWTDHAKRSEGVTLTH